jgi:hypothetical protein
VPARSYQAARPRREPEITSLSGTQVRTTKGFTFENRGLSKAAATKLGLGAAYCAPRNRFILDVTFIRFP